MRPTKQHHRQQRKRSIRAVVRGTAVRPRFTVYRSHTRLTAQLIDDDTGRTIVAASTSEVKAKANMEGAKKLGSLIAGKAKEAKISAVVFDRNGYRYHGSVAAIADAAREGGLTF